MSMMNFDDFVSDKSSYQFNEVTSLTGVKPYVLRFWESEFTQISPILTDEGTKNYSKEDIEVIKQIKGLLFDEKLSIPQAKQVLGVAEEEAEEEVVLGAPEEGASIATTSPALDNTIVLGKLNGILSRINGIIETRGWS